MSYFWRVTMALLVGCHIGAGTATARAQGIEIEKGADPATAAMLEFNQRIRAYMELREHVTDDVPEAHIVADPAKLRAREEALASRIQSARSGAQHGDIFTPEIRALFRRVLSRQATGPYGTELRSILKEDAPAPDAVPLEVNGKYPPGVPFATTPPNVLGALPLLPRGLEYRFVGKDLVLLDQPADVILDYIRNAIN